MGFLYGSYLGVGWDGAYLTCLFVSVCLFARPPISVISLSPDRPPGDDVVAVYCACNGKLGDGTCCCCCNPAAWDARCSWALPPHPPPPRVPGLTLTYIHTNLRSWLVVGIRFLAGVK